MILRIAAADIRLLLKVEMVEVLVVSMVGGRPRQPMFLLVPVNHRHILAAAVEE
jgi:hypothetical protein